MQGDIEGKGSYMTRFLPKGTKIDFVQWVDRKGHTHKGEPPSSGVKNQMANVKSLRVRYTTPNGRTGHFTVNRPFPGRGSVKDRLDKTASLLQGHVDHYIHARR